MSSEQIRREFEEWCGVADLRRDEDGDYLNDRVRGCWEGWKGAISSLPRMTRVDLVELLARGVARYMYHDYPDPELAEDDGWTQYRDEADKQAEALITKLPHIVLPTNNAKE